MVPTALIAVAAGLTTTATIAATAIAITPRPATPPRSRSRRGRDATINAARVLAGAGVGLVVLLATGWVIAAAAGAALVVFWPILLGATSAATELAQVEAIAKWLEDLRDLLRRSSLSVEEAIEIAGTGTRGALSGPLAALVLRRRQGARLTDALWEFAMTVGHPTADSAVAAIQLVVDGGAGGARLYDTLEELAESARDEVRARQEILRLRRVYQRAMRRLVVLTIVFVVALTWFARDLMAPYRQFAGQVWLMIPVGLWTGCIVWLRRLMRFDAGARYRLRRPQEHVA